MALKLFKTLTEYISDAEKEWNALFESRETDVELLHQQDYQAGVTALEAGNYEEAIPHLKKGTGLKQHRKEAYYLLAECYRQLHMLPLARKMYERLMRLDYRYKDVQEKIRELDAPGVAGASGNQAAAFRSAPPDQRATVVAPAEDRYQMLATLYEGPHTRVYKVKDLLLQRTIALKQANRRDPAYETYLQDLKDRIKLDHPNILRIYDIDEQQGQITMEYVEGRNLKDVLRLKGPLTHKMLIYLIIQLTNGLHHAHAKGVIHHLLTPEHLLLTKQCALKITAFRASNSFLDISKIQDPYTYLYIPPELFRQGELSVAANIYSFGVIVYEMFTGQPPFTLPQIKAALGQPATFTYDPTPLPAEIAPVLQRCLAVSPTQRYPNIRAAGEEFIRWHKHQQHHEAHDDNLATYKDFLLVVLADGQITETEVAFLTHKRQELWITDAEAHALEAEVKQELRQMLSMPRK